MLTFKPHSYLEGFGHVWSHLTSEISGQNYDENRALPHALDVAKDLCKQSEGIEKLGSDAWLLSLKTSLPQLSQIVSLLQENDLPFRVTYLDKEPEWIYFKNNSEGTAND